MSGYLYFIQAENGLIKIGISTSPAERALSLASNNSEKITVLGLIKASRFELGKLEREHHERFKKERSHGEWFHPTEELLNVAKSNSIDELRLINLVLENHYSESINSALRKEVLDKTWHPAALKKYYEKKIKEITPSEFKEEIQEPKRLRLHEINPDPGPPIASKLSMDEYINRARRMYLNK